MTKYDIERTYEKWWLFKYLGNGKQIMRVDFVGSPSGMTGIVVLTLDDGTEMRAPMRAYDFRPRKKNLKVFDQPPKETKKCS